jgi:hypothetical protein
MSNQAATADALASPEAVSSIVSSAAALPSE